MDFIIKTSTMTHPDYWTIVKLWNDKRLHENAMFISGLFYKCNCSGCSATCYGKEKRYFKVQIYEHLDVSDFTGEKMNFDNNKLTVIQEYHFCWNYSLSFEDFPILIRESNDFSWK